LLLDDFDQDKLAGPHEIAEKEKDPVAQTLSRKHESSLVTCRVCRTIKPLLG
jgi:hypothetical protein